MWRTGHSLTERMVRQLHVVKSRKAKTGYSKAEWYRGAGQGCPDSGVARTTFFLPNLINYMCIYIYIYIYTHIYMLLCIYYSIYVYCIYMLYMYMYAYYCIYAYCIYILYMYIVYTLCIHILSIYYVSH